MKLKLFSDIHLEFREYLFDHIHLPHNDDKETALLLSGDISTGTSAIPFIEEMCKNFKYVIMISGNHEYYGQDFDKVNSDWANYEQSGSPGNFHFLYNDWRILDGIRFLGGTMWTSFGNKDLISMRYASQRMNDYAAIKRNNMSLTTEFVAEEHDRFINFLSQKLDENFNGPTVVLSHHSPGNALRLRGRKERGDDCYFADIENLIGKSDKISLWVHGHVHQSYDYMINNTRVVCNPYGYWGHSVNGNFNRQIILEV